MRANTNNNINMPHIQDLGIPYSGLFSWGADFSSWLAYKSRNFHPQIFLAYKSQKHPPTNFSTYVIGASAHRIATKIIATTKITFKRRHRLFTKICTQKITHYRVIVVIRGGLGRTGVNKGGGVWAMAERVRTGGEVWAKVQRGKAWERNFG